MTPFQFAISQLASAIIDAPENIRYKKLSDVPQETWKSFFNSGNPRMIYCLRIENDVLIPDNCGIHSDHMNDSQLIDMENSSDFSYWVVK